MLLSSETGTSLTGVMSSVALPTTLSGAEFSPYAGITDETKREKNVYLDRGVTPSWVFLDAELTSHTPSPLWAGTGMKLLGALSRPVPEPPPPGELRKVKITFRCSLCGTEVRMSVAPQEDPEPPRHCQEEMDLVAPID